MHQVIEKNNNNNNYVREQTEKTLSPIEYNQSFELTEIFMKSQDLRDRPWHGYNEENIDL